MSKISENEIMEKYALTVGQVSKIQDDIIEILSYGKTPSENPLSIIVGGQSGAGKTALIDYTSQMSSQRQFVTIDNDFFRSFHPQAEEIKRKYPHFYTAATDQIGLGITSNIISFFRENKYDIILHQTLKNNRIADDAITKFRESGYTVGIRAFAVPYLESKMSQIERCEGQIDELGFCRYVRKVDHDAAIEGLPKTVGYIEESKKFDFLEVFKRGEEISKPIVVYSSFNSATKTDTLKTLSDCENVSHEERHNNYENARDAVEKVREEEAVKMLPTLDSRILEAENHPCNNPEMQIHINELKEIFEQFKIEHQTIDSQECVVEDNA